MNTGGKVYRHIVIAGSPETDIWLGDEERHFVQKAVGTLDTHVLEGNYTVEFGLGTTTYAIHLKADIRYTEGQIKKGPSCPTPIPNIEP